MNFNRLHCRPSIEPTQRWISLMRQWVALVAISAMVASLPVHALAEETETEEVISEEIESDDDDPPAPDPDEPEVDDDAQHHRAHEDGAEEDDDEAPESEVGAMEVDDDQIPVAPNAPGTVVYAVPASGDLPDSQIAVQVSGEPKRLSVKVTIERAAFAPTPTPTAPAGPVGTWQVFVLALVPEAPLSGQPRLLLLKDSRGRWGPPTSPLQAFTQGIDASKMSDQRLTLTILSEFDATMHPGTEFYVGYGTSDREMLANKRFRGIMKIPH